MNQLIDWFIRVLGGIPKEVVVMVISMVPVLEERGGLIAAKLMGLGIWEALFFCIVGNMIPVPFILWFITPLFAKMKKTRLFRPMVEKLESKSMGKSEKIQKYQFWGLMLFVGIPLPGTGAWTGSLIAALLGIRYKSALTAVLLGILLAALIMAIVSYGLLGAILG